MARLAMDDRILAEEFTRLGHVAEPAIWSDGSVDWTRFDAVVIRSCWDYHLRPLAFLTWLATMQSRRVPVLNQPALIRWNLNKRYLLRLRRMGVPTVPTVMVTDDFHRAIWRAARAYGWRDVVVKPAVSASGYGTYRIDPYRVVERRDDIRIAAGGGALLVQPFVEEIVVHGELSLVFIDDCFSHALIKRPIAGDFRVQSEYGGRAEAVEVDDTIVGDATFVLSRLTRRPLYARVDGFVRDGRLVLTELELIEPELFFRLSPEAAARLVCAVVGRSARPADGAVRQRHSGVPLARPLL